MSSQAVRRNLDLSQALSNARERHARDNPKSGEAFEDACGAMPGGNTRTVLYFAPFPLTMVSAEGARLRDADGHEYADFIGDYTAALYGHSHPVIRAAVERALDAGLLRAAPGPDEARLASLMCERFPSCDSVRFTNSGTEATLMAITAARAHTGREAILVFDGAYHGGVFLFLNGAAPTNAPYPFVIGRYNDAAGAQALIDEHAGRLAAILVEPVMGTSGALPATREFLAALREAASRHDVVLVFDEVMTSRLSPGGVQELLDVVPDMTTFGKYLGGGLTFGAFGGRAAIMDRFDPRRPDVLQHAGTFNNNVLTMAAGAAGLGEVYTADVARAHNQRADAFRARLEAIARERGAPVHVTGCGSLLGVHFRREPVHGPEDARAGNVDARALFHLDMLARGFVVGRTGMMSTSLPLADADYAGFETAFDAFLEEHGPLLEAGVD